jgi:reverse gyrase
MFEAFEALLTFDDELIIAASRARSTTLECATMTARLGHMVQCFADVAELFPMHTERSYGWVVRFSDEAVAAKCFVDIYRQIKRCQGCHPHV